MTVSTSSVVTARMWIITGTTISNLIKQV